MEVVFYTINHWLVPPALVFVVEGGLMQFDRLTKFFGVIFTKGEKKGNCYIATVFTAGLLVGITGACIIAS